MYRMLGERGRMDEGPHNDDDDDGDDGDDSDYDGDDRLFTVPYFSVRSARSSASYR